jgi:hypothetical protein
VTRPVEPPRKIAIRGAEPRKTIEAQSNEVKK